MLVIYQFGFLYSQNEWEYVDVSPWKWSIDEKLKYSCNRTSVLNVWNEVAPEPNSYYSTWMYMARESLEKRPCVVTFNVKQARDPKLTYNTYKPDGTFVPCCGDLYWGVAINAKKIYGGIKTYYIQYRDRKTPNFQGTYTDTKKSDDGEWYAILDRYERQYRVVYDGVSKIDIYTVDGSTLTATLVNVSGIWDISIWTGTAANVVVTDFKVLRMTDYGMAKHYRSEQRNTTQSSKPNGGGGTPQLKKGGGSSQGAPALKKTK